MDNESYQKLDLENAFIGPFTKLSAKCLKQWREGLNEMIWPMFLQGLADQVSSLLIDALQQKQLSLLGALFFENAITKLKKLFQS